MPFFGVPIRNGLPIGLGSVAGFGVQQFDPSQLFAGGTVAGAWYDPSDLSTMFTTSAGTTPVAMPGLGSAVSVGLMLDKSQGLAGLGTENIVNGNFSDGTTGWSAFAGATISVVSNELNILCPALSGNGAIQNFVTVPGTSYSVSFRIVNLGTFTAVRLRINNVSPASTFVELQYSSTGVFTSRFTAQTALTQLQYFPVAGTVPGTFVIDDVSVKTLGAGNHAISFNDTTARPELRARVNLLVATATLSTQSVTTQAASYTLRFAGAGSITLSGTATGSYSAGTHTITCTAGTLTLTVSGTVTTADLRPANSGALLPAYQAVVDANTYDTSGFPLYLRFDGVDDSMYTPANLNLSGTDKVAVFAGVRRLIDVIFPMIAELSLVGWDNINGTFGVSGGAGSGRWRMGCRGAAAGAGVPYYDPETYAPPITNVLSSEFNLGGASKATTIVPRVNGVVEQEGGVGTTAGGGNFASQPLFIGSRGNSNLWFNGHLYSLIIAGSAVSAGNISATEQWVAGKTGLVIP